MNFNFDRIIVTIIHYKWLRLPLYLQLMEVGALGVLGIDAQDPVDIHLAVGIAIVTTPRHYMVGIAALSLTQVTSK